jgi:hypothetical protein
MDILITRVYSLVYVSMAGDRSQGVNILFLYFLYISIVIVASLQP